ncbi:MAG: hypothetical protein IBX62_07900 [Coriobacteriia bacterium]|nr:hypothetical protein [Coriobacteriia bacterium]
MPRVSTSLRTSDVIGMWKVRWGIGRMGYRAAPGLYRAGDAGPSSPVIVTANYKMTFDLVRRDLAGLDAWLLVLDTRGVNVWCAAGKGTFGTRELVRRVAETGLSRHVEHATLVLPQLGATGVSSRQVRDLAGYRVVWGPVRSRELRAFLAAGMVATPDMRRVTFTLRERLALAPVELVAALSGWRLAIPAALAALSAAGPWGVSLDALATRGLGAVAVYLAAVLAGAVAVPALLPTIPGRALSVKGAQAGAGAGFAAALVLGGSALQVAAALLGASAVSSLLAVDFTGSTPYTSPSGVERELRRSLPLTAAAAAVAVALWTASAWTG